ncbi:MAG: nucleotidyltransferase domain-containing protein [Thermoleophilia bacterium]|nr:nucleotidyltransferase domain-containing protein [Thermoleophilia bacterium]
MTTAQPSPLDELVLLIAQHACPERIILFGSQARGDARPDSDYDLLIVLPDDADRWETSQRTRMAIAQARLGVPTDLLFQIRSEYDRRRVKAGHLFAIVEREGRDLLAA